MMWRALSIEAWVSKEKRASTSVETFPGMILRISFPNSTRRRSRVASTFWSMSLPCTWCQLRLSSLARDRGTHVVLAVRNSRVDQLCVLFLLRSCEDEGRVRGGILWLVLVDGSKVTRVADDGGAGGLQLVEGRRHGGCSVWYIATMVWLVAV
jgi:hypothetical protein